MSADEIHKNDVGTIFTVTIYDNTSLVDISTALTKQLIFRKPNSSLLTASGTFVTNGVDGKMQYTAVSGDLDQVGNWKLQAKLIFSSGTFFSDITRFKVYENL